MKYTIEPLSNYSEYALICAHWSYSQWYLKRAVPFQAVINDYKNRINNQDLPITYIAVYNSMPIGMASLKEHDLWNRKDLTPWLASLYVIPECRNMGVGEKLIQTIVFEAHKREFHSVFLFLGQKEKNTLQTFYIKRGWEFFESAIDNDDLETEIMKISTEN